MPFEPGERRNVGDSGLSLTLLGFGTAPLGGLFAEVDDEDAVRVVERAWELGVRYFDTAPLYGYGKSERNLGRVLRTKPRDAFVLSTKVGRLVRNEADISAGDDIDRGQGSNWPAAADARAIFDFSADGVRRSIEESLGRLGLDRIDIAYIHDPDHHWDAAIKGAYPALHRLREEGTLRAIGAGMNQSAMLARFVREGDVDVLLVAGRYTLLDQEALPELLPLCLERGVAVTIGGVMNSGVLADPRPGSRFNYATAKPAIVDRAQRLRDVCARHGVPIKAAAAQFPLAHPAVVTVVAGVKSREHLDEYPVLLRHPIPPDLWAELKAEALLLEAAPTPA